MRRIVFALLLVFLFIPVANAFDFNRAEDTDMSRFKLLSMSDDRVVFFDTKTIKYKKDEQGKNMYNVVDVWQRMYYISYDMKNDIENDLNEAGKILSSRQTLEFEIYHCYYNIKEKTYSPVQRIVYDENGKIIYSENFVEHYEEIVPGTGGEIWFNGIKKYAKENHSIIKKRF